MKSAIEAGTSAATAVTVEEAWSEAVRELGVRSRCFDNWVGEGKLAWADARDRYARLAMAATILAIIADDPTAGPALVKAAIERMAENAKQGTDS